ncbi:MAG: type IV pilin protein [Halioglobus sp.]
MLNKISMGRASRISGFTLIELMIVVVIVSVLLAIALPAYQNQVIRANRSAAQAEMMDIASRQQQFLLSNRSYMDKTTLETNGFVLDPDVSSNYTYTLTVGVATVPSYLITFMPSGGFQASDPDMSLNDLGTGTPTRFWER